MKKNVIPLLFFMFVFVCYAAEPAVIPVESVFIKGGAPVYTLKGSIPTQSSYIYPKPVKMPEIIVNKNADGYRLPEETEWIYFALGGWEGIKSKWWETKPVETYAKII